MDRHQRQYREKKEDGFCVYRGCWQEAVPGEVHCGFHQETLAERRRERHLAGRCECGNPREDKGRCPTCLAARRKREREVYGDKKRSGICVRGGCHKKAAPDDVRCEDHRARERKRKE